MGGYKHRRVPACGLDAQTRANHARILVYICIYIYKKVARSLTLADSGIKGMQQRCGSESLWAACSAQVIVAFRPGPGGGGPEIRISSPQEAIWHRRSLCRLGGGGEGSRRRARKIDPRRLPAILVLLGLAGCSYTWATKWSSPELVAPTGSEKTK